jgi:hypothetical protein
MWALKVTRSTIAATSLGSGNTAPHSLKGRFVAIAMLARSSHAAALGAVVDLGGEDLGEVAAVSGVHARRSRPSVLLRPAPLAGAVRGPRR